MKVLCTADIHIGRRASRLASRVDDERRFTAANAWIDIVDYAIDQEISLLLLAGDVVDQENRYFEAYGPLEIGLKRLASHGIRTLAVAGNHDIEVLPKLDRALDATDFRLLGRGGQWECYPFEQDGQPIMHIYGWSFPQQHFRDNPITDFQVAHEDDAPVIVMLHADLDNANSSYGPVSKSDLERHNCDFWLLGHIHQPWSGELKTGSHFLYPGSPMALDPGEKGQHGPWMLEVSGHSIKKLKQVPLSRVRYEQFEISLDGIEDETAFQSQLISSFSEKLAKQITDPGKLEIVSSRLYLSGRSKIHRQISKLSEAIVEDLEITIHNAAALVEKIVDNTRPDIDLESLAREKSSAGILAQILLVLESRRIPAKHQMLLHEVTQKMSEVYTAKPFTSLADTNSPPDEEASITYFYRAGLDLLDALISQQERS